MEKECIYIKELKQKNKYYKKIILTIIIIIAIIALLTIHWDRLKYIFYNYNGNFSNDILWTSIGAIGSILAFVGVILTILYTEKARFKQNEYEYYKRQKEEEEIEFKKELKKQIHILNPINAVEITMKNLDDSNYIEITNLLNAYICKIKAVPRNIHWYYNEANINKAIKYNEFNRLLVEEVEHISNIINKYTTYIINWFSNKSIYRSLRNLELCGQLKAEEKEEYNKVKLIYEDPRKSNEAINIIGNYKMELIKISNEKMPIIEAKAKEIIEERNLIIKKELNSLE